MCLSTVYKESDGKNELLCKNIAKVENRADTVVFTDIMGRQTLVSGIIVSIDLMENIIKVKEEKA